MSVSFYPHGIVTVGDRKARLVPEFVGYYTTQGPTGYVTAKTRDEASALAKRVTEIWPNAHFDSPRCLGPRYCVAIWTV